MSCGVPESRHAAFLLLSHKLQFVMEKTKMQKTAKTIISKNRNNIIVTKNSHYN